MPGSRKFTSNLHEISHLICVITSGSCLENSSDFKHSFGLDIEATVKPGHRVKSLVSTLKKYSEVNLCHATVALHQKWKDTLMLTLFAGCGGYSTYERGDDHI